jgi:hypothetical protein
MRIQKYVFSTLLIATFLVLASGWSFAGPVLQGGNTTLAAEKIPTSGDGYVVGSGLASQGVYVAYSGATLGANGQLLITLSGGKFNTTTPELDLCDESTGAAMGTYQHPGGQSATSMVYLLSQPLSPGTSYTVQPTTTCGQTVDTLLTPTVTPLTDILVPAGSPAGTTVTMTIADNVSPSDANVLATGTIVTVVNQFSATVTPVTSTLSFNTTPVALTGFTASGSAVPYTSATDSYAGITIFSNQNISDLVNVPGNGALCEASLESASDAFVVTVAGNLAGLLDINYDQDNVVSPSPFTTAQLAANSVSLSIPGDQALICYSGGANPAPAPVKPIPIAIQVPSNPAVAIGAGTYTLDVTLTGAGSDAKDVASGYSRDIMTPTAVPQLEWTIVNPSNTYYIESIATNPAQGQETYIMLQSSATASGLNGVSVQILSTKAACMATMAPYTATINPGTPLVILGSQLANWATNQSCPVNTSGFAAIVTVNAPNDALFEYAQLCTPGIGCSPIPVATKYTTATTSSSRGFGGMSLDYGHGGGGGSSSGSFSISPSTLIIQ